MPRVSLAYEVGDISALARSLRAGLAGRTGVPGDGLPSHLEMLNLLARAAGCRNFQHFRAQATARPEVAPEQPSPEPAADSGRATQASPPDIARCQRAVRLFDAAGVLTRWPTRRNQQILCLWVLWSRIPSGESFTEKAMNAVLNRWHAFGDHALLRRELVELRLMSRTRDGRDYRRIEQPPPPELGALLGMLRNRPNIV